MSRPQHPHDGRPHAHGPEQRVSLPADHAFVLQFRDGAVTGPSGPWAGRVEHIVSGRSMRFEDCRQLCAFIAATLGAPDD